MLIFLFIAFVFVAVIGFGIWMFRWQYGRADEALENWARDNNFKVLSKQDANPPGTGPKDRYAGNKQIWYRVTVEDAGGKKRTGIVKIGSESTGTLSDQISVEWDD
ncbi:MAG: hypothetical protein R2684_00780 [Pyrinomonadaceae bacterium]